MEVAVSPMSISCSGYPTFGSESNVPGREKPVAIEFVLPAFKGLLFNFFVNFSFEKGKLTFFSRECLCSSISRRLRGFWPLFFYDEILTFTVKQSSLEVRARFFFRNCSPVFRNKPNLSPTFLALVVVWGLKC